MAENEYLDVTNAARWQSVVQAIRDDLAMTRLPNWSATASTKR